MIASFCFGRRPETRRALACALRHTTSICLLSIENNFCRREDSFFSCRVFRVLPQPVCVVLLCLRYLLTHVSLSLTASSILLPRAVFFAVSSKNKCVVPGMFRFRFKNQNSVMLSKLGPSSLKGRYASPDAIVSFRIVVYRKYSSRQTTGSHREPNAEIQGSIALDDLRCEESSNCGVRLSFLAPLPAPISLEGSSRCLSAEWNPVYITMHQVPGPTPPMALRHEITLVSQ